MITFAKNHPSLENLTTNLTKIFLKTPQSWNNITRVRNRRRAGNKRRAWKIWQKE